MPEERERELVAYFGAEPGVDQVIPTSALKGRNVDAVERWAVAQLPLGPSLYPKVRGAHYKQNQQDLLHVLLNVSPPLMRWVRTA